MKSSIHSAIVIGAALGVTVLLGCSDASKSSELPMIGFWIGMRNLDKSDPDDKLTLLELRADGIYVLRIVKRTELGKASGSYEFAKGQWQIVSYEDDEYKIKVPDGFSTQGPLQYFQQSGKFDLAKASDGSIKIIDTQSAGHTFEMMEFYVDHDDSGMPGNVWYLYSLSESGSLSQLPLPEFHSLLGTFVRIDAEYLREYKTETIRVKDDMKPHELQYLTRNRKGPESPLTRLGFVGTHTP